MRLCSPRTAAPAWSAVGVAPERGLLVSNLDGRRLPCAGTFESGWVASDDGKIAPTNANLACSSAYDSWTSTAGTNENLPINCVNWWEAYAFCIWDGGFLPSDAEAGYAAAGGDEQREYPWGSMTPGTTNQYAIYGCYYSKLFGRRR